MSGVVSKVLVYQHIPKCGGTAFREACGRMFPVTHELLPDRSDAVAWDGFAANVPDPQVEGERVVMITGHYVHEGVRPWERFAPLRDAGGNVEWLTVLREPLDRVISSFYYRQQREAKVPHTLEDWVKRKRNTQSRYLGYEGGGAANFLDRYVFVGITERLQESVGVLAAQLDCVATDVGRANVTTRKRAELAPGLAEKFRERNELDYELYEAGAAWLEAASKKAKL